jgi:hypothetical protein
VALYVQSSGLLSLPLLTSPKAFHRRIAPLTRRGFDPLHDYVVNFHPLIKGGLAQSVMNCSRQVDRVPGSRSVLRPAGALIALRLRRSQRGLPLVERHIVISNGEYEKHRQIYLDAGCKARISRRCKRFSGSIRPTNSLDRFELILHNPGRGEIPFCRTVSLLPFSPRRRPRASSPMASSDFWRPLLRVS